MAPAEKAKSQGSRLEIDAARKNPATAKIGSTIPLSVPNQKAFFLFPRQLYNGNEVAKPSGKFCSAIPSANINATKNDDCVATAVPKVKPTDNPSGIL